MLQDLYASYYEQPRSIEMTPAEERRVSETISFIPSDVESLLEVGCGDGRIINRLAGKYRNIVGMDISEESLKYVIVPKTVGSVDNLPFQDKSFDITICCETLEHLPSKIYQKALEEISRVTRNYIIITVPNNENLDIAMVKCPHCGCSFHPCRHLRSFDKAKLDGLFPQFTILKLDTIMANQKVYTTFLVTIARILNLIPKIIFAPPALCPQCGCSPSDILEDQTEQSSVVPNRSFLLNLFRSIGRHLLSKLGGGWLIALYKKS